MKQLSELKIRIRDEAQSCFIKPDTLKKLGQVKNKPMGGQKEVPGMMSISSYLFQYFSACVLSAW